VGVFFESSEPVSKGAGGSSVILFAAVFPWLFSSPVRVLGFRRSVPSLLCGVLRARISHSPSSTRALFRSKGCTWCRKTWLT
jgi:hypothetical protein